MSAPRHTVRGSVARATAAVLGVAMLAGLLAGCTTSSGPRGPERTSAPAASPTPSSSGDVRSMAVVGDSISVGYNACDAFGPCSRVNWATGSAMPVRSLAARLGNHIAVHDLAVPGARMQDAAAQLDRLTAPVDLVGVLMGANDLCAGSVGSMTPVGDFGRQLQQLLAAVDAKAPHARVLLLSVPDVVVLSRVQDVPAQIASARIDSGACGSVLGDREHGVTAGDLAAVQQREQAYDAAIRSACERRSRCVDDGGAVTAHRFSADEISTLDYFHPSEAGQRTIAAIAWNALQRGRA